ncbi:hypothetical protein SEA_REFUGE_90 [Mycobacterium phage Refuge]|uniref:DUF7273 domain-containing protein n=1 Tax=Mycobacterium phage Refuge TaxID=2517967 RepID=A0A482JBF6_9CAUD|nr:hypothetical protein KIV61_gp13 [Mycobacterium phage Refuge]QBP31107.1 hypothetical protein SEA_REFUGE_90 [Mycobacterium phage Refuge]
MSYLTPTEHDQRWDLSSELWTVSEELAIDGKPCNAEACAQLAIAVKNGEANILLAQGLLGHYENMIGA